LTRAAKEARRPEPWLSFHKRAPVVAAFVAGVGLSVVALRPTPVPAVAMVEPAPTPTVDAAPLGALPASPFGGLHSLPSAETLAPQPRLQGVEMLRFVEAANFYRKGAFPQGDASASAIADPIARAALDWIALRVSATPQRLDAFEKAHPDWPMAEWMRTVREGWLFSGKPTPAETLATLGADPPLTAQGQIALARADLALGKRDEAAAVVRGLWRDGDPDPAAETILLREFGVLLTRDDHRARASRQAYAERGATAWRAAALAGSDVMALINARLEAARGPLSARASSAVPQALRTDPGYLFAHVQDSRRSGRLDEAIGWLKLAPSDPDKLVDPDKWWSERRMVARMLIDRGQYDKAYAVAAEGVARSSPSKVDAAFHAGWIALRFLNDPARAAGHFATAAAAAETPISIARAYYWRGRAAEALEQNDAARGFYAKAAAYPIAYYGQLAARKLGAAEITLRRPVTAALGDGRAEATRVIDLYLTAGLDDFVAPVAYAAAKTWSDGAQLAALAEVLRAKASAATNVTFGKLATERGFPLDAVAFPTFGLPEYQPLAGSAGLGQVMAVARQESEFLPRAASGVGAKGLMQVMPATAADTARKVGVAYDFTRLIGDPAYNMQLGAAYLGQVLAAEGGSLEMAAAAYNAGPGAVAKWASVYGDPRAGADVVDWVERIPYDETRDYVMRVAENYGVYQARLAEPPEPRAGGALARR
jgi:soluble lytic murein transglycosylase